MGLPRVSELFLPGQPMASSHNLYLVDHECFSHENTLALWRKDLNYRDKRADRYVQVPIQVSHSS
ncbi:hypothetical protein CPC08DRAFT_708581 [Agrocybe pediades]|nr:hypothetical protein CPC08DRAFT_708581 [Agrocybe pediades]